MDIQPGNHVQVNLAPFIGSTVRSKDSVPCLVEDVAAGRVLVTTQPPYREVSLWVDVAWVEHLVPVAGRHTRAARRRPTELVTDR